MGNVRVGFSVFLGFPVNQKLVTELAKINESAARSLEEGLEEKLTLHRLDVFVELGTSFKTTNLIESVMARVDAKTRRHRALAYEGSEATLVRRHALQLEHQFRRVRAYTPLPLLQAALTRKLAVHIAAA